MEKGVLLVVGAGGDVGRGIVQAALRSGRKVVAAGRDPAKLANLGDESSADRLATVAGDIASESGAERMWEAASQAFGGVSDVVVSVNAPNRVGPLLEWKPDELGEVLAGNVVTHFVAARTFLPRLPETGMLIGIGGGTADFIFPGMTPVSMAQAALRMLYRGLAKERRSGAQMRELMIVAMVAGQSNRDRATPDWVTDLEVGNHVCAILDEPGRFPEPILRLLSREQVGHAEDELALNRD